MTSRTTVHAPWRSVRRTAHRVTAAWLALRSQPRYAGYGPGELPTRLPLAARLALLAHAWRDVPPVAGRGMELRYERGAWVLRPTVGWRSYRLAPVPYRTTVISESDPDAAADWAARVYAR